VPALVPKTGPYPLPLLLAHAREAAHIWPSSNHKVPPADVWKGMELGARDVRLGHTVIVDAILVVRASQQGRGPLLSISQLNLRRFCIWKQEKYPTKGAHVKPKSGRMMNESAIVTLPRFAPIAVKQIQYLHFRRLGGEFLVLHAAKPSTVYLPGSGALRRRDAICAGAIGGSSRRHAQEREGRE